MTCRSAVTGILAAAAIVTCACSKAPPPNGLRYQLNGPLIPARMTMVTAWDYPKNPVTDTSLDDSKLSKDIAVMEQCVIELKRYLTLYEVRS